jgi:hypothetical protein
VKEPSVEAIAGAYRIDYVYLQRWTELLFRASACQGAFCSQLHDEHGNQLG